MPTTILTNPTLYIFTSTAGVISVFTYLRSNIFIKNGLFDNKTVRCKTATLNKHLHLPKLCIKHNHLHLRPKSMRYFIVVAIIRIS